MNIFVYIYIILLFIGYINPKFIKRDVMYELRHLYRFHSVTYVCNTLNSTPYAKSNSMLFIYNTIMGQ